MSYSISKRLGFLVGVLGLFGPFLVAIMFLKFAQEHPHTVTTSLYLTCLKISFALGGAFVAVGFWSAISVSWVRLAASVIAAAFVLYGTTTDYSACTPVPEFREQPFEACP